MLTNDYSHELRVALAAAAEATNLCQRVQASVTPQTIEKRDKSPVTIADFGSQALIARALRQAFPSIPLIAEETSSALRHPDNAQQLLRVREEVARSLAKQDVDDDELCEWIDHGNASDYADVFWTLDPIDGTKGFLRGQQYAIALALIVDGEPVCATLACPNLANSDGSVGAIFSANNGLAMAHYAEAQTTIAVSPRTDFETSRFCESVESGHSDHKQSQAIASLLGIAGESVRMDSQAKYAAVARGDAEIYLRLPTRPGYVECIWDHAAGYAILKAAGGEISDVDGKALDFRQGSGLKNNRGVVASNGSLHKRLIEAILATS